RRLELVVCVGKLATLEVLHQVLVRRAPAIQLFCTSNQFIDYRIHFRLLQSRKSMRRTHVDDRAHIDDTVCFVLIIDAGKAQGDTSTLNKGLMPQESLWVCL